MVKGKLSISRNNIDNQIFVTLEDKETGNLVVQTEITPENFKKRILIQRLKASSLQEGTFLFFSPILFCN